MTKQEGPASCQPLLFLIGYRGTGKTTVARLLAERLGWSWLDADAELERRVGFTISDIFANEGEGEFRDREAALLHDLATLNHHVVATGGGVVLREDNRSLLRKGFVAWLTADAETLWNRLQQDAATNQRRPNLAQGGLAEIEDLLRQRTPLYAACADFIVDTAQQSPEAVALAIHQWFVKKLASVKA